MGEAILLYAASFALAGLILAVGYGMTRRHPVPYLRFYFFYLIVFCLGYFLSRPIPRLLGWALRMDAERDAFLSAIVVASILQPLAILGFYLFYRFAAAWLGKKASPVFLGITFPLLTLHWLATAFSSFRFLRTGSADPIAEFFHYSGDWIYVALALSLFGWLIVGARGGAGQGKTQAVRTFGLLGFLGLVFYNLVSLAGLSGTWQPLLFLAQAIPALVSLHEYVRRERRSRPLIEGNEEAMNALFALYRISPREQDIIRHIGHGLTNRQIADRLFLSQQSVKNSIHGIFQKMRVKNRIQLVNVFLQPYGKTRRDGDQYPIQEKGE